MKSIIIIRLPLDILKLSPYNIPQSFYEKGGIIMLNTTQKLDPYVQHTFFCLSLDDE